MKIFFLTNFFLLCNGLTILISWLKSIFKQAKQNRAFEDVIFQIQEAILKGEPKEGDKLLGERKLRENFGISRGTLREALRALEQKRLITIKTGVGGGGFVCDIDTRQMSEGLDLLLQYQKVSLRELAEFRENVEGLVAAKAAQKAKKADINQLNLYLMSIKNLLDAKIYLYSIVKERFIFSSHLITTQSP